MITVNNISKSFSAKHVLRSISFDIEAGQIVGLIGPNGSGKTTLLNILLGLIKPSIGSFTFKSRQKPCMMVSRNGYFADTSVKNNLEIFSMAQGFEKHAVQNILNEFGIDFASKRFGQLSAGMKQRVALAHAFVQPSDIMLLDEPTNHLDIDSIIVLRKKILELKAKGTTFLITSHIFSDLEKICNRILLLKEGALILDGMTADLTAKYNNLEEMYITLLKNSPHV